MTVVREAHEAHGATFTTVGGHAIPAHYGRPQRAHHAVRRVVGVTEQPYGVLIVTGTDREGLLDSCDAACTPTADGTGTYLFHLDPEGRIASTAYVYYTPDRLLCFTAPGTERLLAEAWRDLAHEEGLSLEVSLAGSTFGIFDVYGPKATEKVASVLTGPGVPDERYTFVRGRIGEYGVTVVRTDDLVGEEGYEVVCEADHAPRVFDALLNHGLNAAPFGRQTWETLTLEAGTPLFSSELGGRRPGALGLSHIGGPSDTAPSGSLVGIRPGTVPEPGTSVSTPDGTVVGTVTRGAVCPSLGGPAALAVIDGDCPDGLELNGTAISPEDLPLVHGSAPSGRLPVTGVDG